jgi:hypothetical protein
MEEHMTRQCKLYLLAFGFLLGTTPNVFAQGPTFTTIDFPGASTTTPWGINTRGDIVGLFVNADKSTHGFLLSEGQYSQIDFPGATGTELYGINPAGDLVGVYTLDGRRRGFLQKKGQFTKIDFPDATSTETGAINPRGDIVGLYVTADKKTHGFLLSADQFSTIDFPGATVTFPSGINPQGEIAGAYDGHAYLLIDGDFTSFDVPGSTFTNTTGLNARGEIVGRYVAGGVSHGYLLTGGQFSTIDFPGATFNGAIGINQRGDILGRYRKADGVTHGFLLAGFRPDCIATSAPSVISVPALLSVSGDGRGQGAIQHADTYQVASSSNPAVSGEILALYFTGLVEESLVPPQVTIGGRTADVLFSGNAPGYAGLNQANVRMPSGVAPGTAVPVRLTYLSRTSNEVTIGVR